MPKRATRLRLASRIGLEQYQSHLCQAVGAGEMVPQGGYAYANLVPLRSRGPWPSDQLRWRVVAVDAAVVAGENPSVLRSGWRVARSPIRLSMGTA
jgi:hypothetical protein